MGGFSIEQATIPASLDVDADGAGDFRASVAVQNASETRAYGTTDVSYTAEELFPNWNDPHQPKTLWHARVDGRIVARAVHESQLGTEREVGWLDIDVHPDFERHGIGRALADTVEAHSRALGQAKLLTYAVSPVPHGGRRMLAPPTGFGAVSATNREVRFLLARGWRLEQVERASRLALPAASGVLAQAAVDARASAGADYDVVTWRGTTPEPWLADLAVLLTRMSTDAPTAGLEEPEDPWTPDRVAEHDLRVVGSSRETLTAAALHVRSGRLVAFNQLAVPEDPARPVSQQDTLVLREHRGHRLGMLVKVANLDQLQRVAPGHPSLLTWNAEENRHMLGINEALGFVPIGYEGAWRLDL
ncbi:GNAT family N-acetyltransferase [Subtercola boreus]|uniref:GNAT family N-acetyltransferase n=1 Tax=Subtercola boreus TaxID=120213 RepID=UPI00116D975E|nr:GNAT family N-acetyltransferase [Subtercola boreus]TQL55796.1 acetyltransferase (GNAT) family protein [Subtercola boreus]